MQHHPVIQAALRRRRVLAIMLAVIALGATGSSQENADIKLETDTFSSAAVCGQCHKEIYRHWKRGMHALGFKDPVFQAALMKAYWQTRGEAAALCLSCHAPTIALTGDVQARLDITAEGVTCDFCHSLEDVHPDRSDDRFSLNLGVKYGPRENVESPVHEVKSSSLFTSSKLCAGCHEWKNANGVHLLSTYSEWAESSYAERGQHCQSCHMPEIEGRIVDPSVKEVESKVINEHDLSGGHSITQVKKALRVGFRSVSRTASSITVQIDVENVGSGHYIPTGMPTRVVVLAVTATAGRRSVFEHELYYRKEVVDATGRLLTDDVDVMLRGAAIRRDSRIPPGGVITETLSIPVSGTRDVVVSARAYYRYAAQLMMPELLEIEMAMAEKVIPRASVP